MLIFPSLRMGLYFLLEEGVFPQFQGKKKVFTVTAAVCQLKGRFTFLKRSDYTGEILHFLNVHDTCTVSVCNEKLRNDLIKGINYTPDYLGQTKNDGFQQNTQQNWTAVNELFLTIASFEPLRFPYNFRLISWFFRRKPLQFIR